MRRAAKLAVVGLTFSVVAAGTLHAQGPSPARGRRDTIMFLIHERIDGVGTRALISSEPDTTKPYYVDIVRSAITPQLVAAVLSSARSANTKPLTGPEQLKILFGKKSALAPVPAKDKARVDAIVARLKRAPQREVKGIGLQRAVAVAIR